MSCLRNGLDASRPWATTASSGLVAPALMRSQLPSVASASTIMIATSSLPFGVGDDTTGDGEVEDGVFELAELRERDPLVADRGDEREADAADRTVERQAGDLGRRAMPR